MTKRTFGKVFVFLSLLFVCVGAFAQSDCTNLQAGGLFDSVVTNFHSGTSTWLTNAEKYAADIFWSLAILEFAWSAITWILKKNTIGEWLASLFFKMMSIAFFYWIISMAPTWIPLVLQGFQTLATGITQGTGTSIPTVSGMSGMISPSAVMGSGVCIVQTMFSGSSNWVSSGLAESIMFGLAIVFACIIIGIAYFIITLQLVLTEIEAFIVLFGGLVMLGFTGSRWTSPWGERYFGYAVSVGVKLMVIYLVISLGNSAVLNGIMSILNGTNNISGGGAGAPLISDIVQIIMIVLVYAGMAWSLPSMAGSFLNGSPNMSMGNMAAPAMAATGAAVGAVAGVAAAAGSAGNALGNAVGSAFGSGGGGGMPTRNNDSYGMAALQKASQRAYESNNNTASSSSRQSPMASGAGSASAGGSGNAATGSKTSNASTSGGGTDSSSAGNSANTSSGTENAFSDPNAGNAGNSANTNSNSSSSASHSGNSRLNQFAQSRLQNAAQHLKSSDGSTGSISIRFNHTD